MFGPCSKLRVIEEPEVRVLGSSPAHRLTFRLVSVLAFCLALICANSAFASEWVRFADWIDVLEIDMPRPFIAV